MQDAIEGMHDDNDNINIGVRVRRLFFKLLLLSKCSASTVATLVAAHKASQLL